MPFTVLQCVNKDIIINKGRHPPPTHFLVLFVHFYFFSLLFAYDY